MKITLGVFGYRLHARTGRHCTSLNVLHMLTESLQLCETKVESLIPIVLVVCFLQELMTVFQLLHWNGSLKAMRERQCSRQVRFDIYKPISQMGLIIQAQQWFSFFTWSISYTNKSSVKSYILWHYYSGWIRHFHYLCQRCLRAAASWKIRIPQEKCRKQKMTFS